MQLASRFWVNHSVITVSVTRTGIVSAAYNTEFKKHRHLCHSILRRLGFGQRVMETRILMEVEDLIAGIQEEQDRSFDARQLVTSCLASVMFHMVFGRRSDHSSREFQQLISDINYAMSNIPFELDFLPLLRLLPYYRKKVADNIAVIKRGSDYINEMIAACREVCRRPIQYA